MSKELIVDGKKYQPCAVLARQFSYTSDYLSKLAREEKVDATRVGRQWFIVEASLSNFLDEAARKKEKRSSVLREERKLERKKHQTGKKAEVVSVSRSLDIPAVSNTLAQALVLVGCGWLVGLLGYVVYEQNVTSNIFASAALETYAQVEEAVVVRSLHGAALEQSAFLDFSTLFNWFKKDPAIVDEEVSSLAAVVTEKESEYVALDEVGETKALIILDSDVASTTIESIKSSFSDEVEVEFDGEGQGMIKPVFKRENDQSYRFLLVPTSDSVTR